MLPRIQNRARDGRPYMGSKSCCRRYRPPPCYLMFEDFPHISPFASTLSSNGRYTFRPRAQQCKIQNGRLQAVSQTVASPNFPQFNLLPREIQEMIWHFAAQEPRIVSVRISNGKRTSGFRSLISTPPPLLHTCSISRSIGLKYTTLSFASEPIHANNNMIGPLDQNSIIPPKVYFNPEIDTLWFGPTWNQDVDGKWCCLNQLHTLLDLDDLKLVRNVGFDLRAKTCSTRRNDNEIYIHRPDFGAWSALEKVYLGLNKRHGDCKGEIVVRELEKEEEMRDFMNVYEGYWRKCSGPSSGVAGEETEIECWYRPRKDEAGKWISEWEQFKPVIVNAL